MHESFSLIDVASLCVDSHDELLRHVFDELASWAMLSDWLL